MQIKILGSAAAEGWPALFCECPACVQARINGGKDIRRRCCYLIDNDTMVDFGPDIYAQSLTFNIDLAKVNRIFFTHSHCDHLSAMELTWRHQWFSKVANPVPMEIYGNQAVIDTITEYHKKGDRTIESLKCAPLRLMEPGDTIQSGDITATALKATHAPTETALNYIIQRNGKTILIANDTGWWCDESWQLVEKFKIDIAIIECCHGLKFPDYNVHHMGANISVAFRDELRKRGALKDDAVVAVNHFSHNIQNLHAELEDFFLPKGILVGYDGMILE